MCVNLFFRPSATKFTKRVASEDNNGTWGSHYKDSSVGLLIINPT
jgi:hypothetical protein